MADVQRDKHLKDIDLWIYNGKIWHREVGGYTLHLNLQYATQTK
jgi:hypothetical protein